MKNHFIDLSLAYSGATATSLLMTTIQDFSIEVVKIIIGASVPLILKHFINKANNKKPE